MNDEGENRQSVLFRIHNCNTVYSVPAQHISCVESIVGKMFPILRAPAHFLGVCRLREKNISIVDLGHLLGLEQISGCESKNQNLLVIENTQVGFLVETVLRKR